MMKFLLPLAIALLLPAEDLRMNQIQVLGSHNSYKLPIDPSLLSVLRKTMADRLPALEYSHQPLTVQLDMGLRSLELDVVHDPEGGRYANPEGIAAVKQSGLTPGPPYDPQGLMKKPGFKVLHVQDIDFRSSVYTFRQALSELRKWSVAHPRHLPIIITMNAKDSAISRPNTVKPLPFDRAAFDQWDAEIREILPPSNLITPDDVRGRHRTLEEAVLAHAWPKLDDARGKFMFVLDETGKKLDDYAAGHPSLRGRVMFVDAREGVPEASFRIVNEPRRDLNYIQYLVRSGYMVRTRADADTVEARKNDYTRWQAALASGAHVISTDYYAVDPALKTGYFVKLPGNQPGRWNILLLPSIRPLPAVE